MELHQLLGLAIAWDPADRRTYRFHLTSYLQFIKIHRLDPTPTAYTLALYIVYMCQYIKPELVEKHLKGIVHYFTPIYPSVVAARSSLLVVQTLRGSKKVFKTPALRDYPLPDKHPLLLTELQTISKSYRTKNTHDDFLFVSQLLTGFFALLRLGEIVYPDDPTDDCPSKMPQRQSLHLSDSEVSFILPYHKEERSFRGDEIQVRSNSTPADPITAIQRYLQSRDRLFPDAQDLWIRENGSRPRRTWFLNRLRQFCDPSTGERSLRAGGVTTLLEYDFPHDSIRIVGRWSFKAFQIYIGQHPSVFRSTLLQNRR